MAKSKAPRKKFRPNQNQITATRFWFSEDDRMERIYRHYLMVEAFRRGHANEDWRTQLRVHLVMGISLLQSHFDNIFEAQDLLEEALAIIGKTRNKVTRKIEAVTTADGDTVHRALQLIDEILQQCSLWEEVQSIKEGEDMCLLGASTKDYVFGGYVQ